MRSFRADYCVIAAARGNFATELRRRRLILAPNFRLDRAMSNEARRVEHQLTDKGYVPVYTTAVVEQPWADYTATDHEVWATQYAELEKVAPLMLEEWSQTKKAPRHADWLHIDPGSLAE